MRPVLPLAVFSALAALVVLGMLYRGGGGLAVEAVNLTESSPWVGGCDVAYVEVANGMNIKKERAG